jgi:hypothetical protein
MKRSHADRSCERSARLPKLIDFPSTFFLKSLVYLRKNGGKPKRLCGLPMSKSASRKPRRRGAISTWD